MERSFLCKLLNLNVEKEEYLSILEEGQCLIRVNSIKEPFLLKIPFIKREYVTVSEIIKNNNNIQNYKKKEDINEFKHKSRKLKTKLNEYLAIVLKKKVKLYHKKNEMEMDYKSKENSHSVSQDSDGLKIKNDVTRKILMN